MATRTTAAFILVTLATQLAAAPRQNHESKATHKQQACLDECSTEQQTVECSDLDKDSLCDAQDNCFKHFNPEQLDVDADRIGDACDGTPRLANNCAIGHCTNPLKP